MEIDDVRNKEKEKKGNNLVLLRHDKNERAANGGRLKELPL